MHVGARSVFKTLVWAHLGEEGAELFEGLEQTGILDLLDDKDTCRWCVPGQSLAGRVLNVPSHTATQNHAFRRFENPIGFPQASLQTIAKRQRTCKEFLQT